MQGVDLRTAKLQGARLEGAILCGATLTPDQRAMAEAEGALLGPIQSLGTAQHWFTDEESHEYKQWHGAFHLLEANTAFLGGEIRGGARVIDKVRLTALIDSVDVSRAEKTLIKKLKLIQAIDAAPEIAGSPGWIAFGAVSGPLTDFTDQVKEKSANHCVGQQSPPDPQTDPWWVSLWDHLRGND